MAQKPKESGSAALWSGVERVLDRTASHPETLAAHGIHLLAARRWRLLGMPVPPAIEEAEIRNSAVALLTPQVVALVRDACDGPVIVLKGIEVARLYPDPGARPCVDLDVLVAKPEQLRARLIRRGFEDLPDPVWLLDAHRLPDVDPFVGEHHVGPVRIARWPVPVEIHRRPSWPDRLPGPPLGELLEAKVPSQVVEGVFTLAPAHHALVLVAHGWTHSPLAAIRQLIDVAAMVDEADEGDLAALARRWGLTRMLDATMFAADALFADAPPSWPLRSWARHLLPVRERTVAENHLARWLSPFAALPAAEALTESALAFAAEFRAAEGEPLRDKLTRVAAGLRHPLAATSSQSARLGDLAHRRARRPQPPAGREPHEASSCP